MEKKVLIGTVIISIVLIVGVIFFLGGQNTNRKYDQFAKCLREKGAIFYGAFWCPHCQNQKKLFGSSEQYLPYIECSTADGKGQLQACGDKHISGYPTWEFKNGERKSGEVSLEDLAQKTSCQLPE
ncbi:MAG: hypothetical protein A3F31_02965 [Candidatus Levybacteria bacterium RIFCSPHIGHO2_12_FULL_38_12]|nr:MAG: hypothetical protein A2770_00525 [Candidatus Levybacteria bacterium RIFCSPHIGHO2_01_FULL_38_12]OGH22649.1 MAG: hypothetical protein A3F31_02965 [Candidatus Levybacteria bacterium RIFCSPHIGHO2_12_FULL_38_12]OGH44988.1 MAG: hypothetical protein A3J14_03885 [Candidatus Levybacteria bacterium RIFCSPLOWO2_02_FULL_37_18]